VKDRSLPPFNRQPKNNTEGMMMLIWLVKNAPDDERFEVAMKKIKEHEERCTSEEVQQAMLNMKEFDYFINPRSN